MVRQHCDAVQISSTEELRKHTEEVLHKNGEPMNVCNTWQSLCYASLIWRDCLTYWIKHGRISQATTKGLFLAWLQEADMLGTSKHFDRCKAYVASTTKQSLGNWKWNDRLQSCSIVSSSWEILCEPCVLGLQHVQRLHGQSIAIDPKGKFQSSMS